MKSIEIPLNSIDFYSFLLFGRMFQQKWMTWESFGHKFSDVEISSLFGSTKNEQIFGRICCRIWRKSKG